MTGPDLDAPLPFEEFRDAHEGRLGQALALAVSSSSLGQAAANEAWAEAANRWPDVGSGRDPAGWVYRTGLRWATSGSRGRRLRRATPAAGPTSDLREALRAMSPIVRGTLVAHLVLDYDPLETADALGVSRGTIESRLNDATTSLSTHLDREVTLAELAETLPTFVELSDVRGIIGEGDGAGRFGRRPTLRWIVVLATLLLGVGGLVTWLRSADTATGDADPASAAAVEPTLPEPSHTRLPAEIVAEPLWMDMWSDGLALYTWTADWHLAITDDLVSWRYLPWTPDEMDGRSTYDLPSAAVSGSNAVAASILYDSDPEMCGQTVGLDVGLLVDDASRTFDLSTSLSAAPVADETLILSAAMDGSVALVAVTRQAGVRIGCALIRAGLIADTAQPQWWLDESEPATVTFVNSKGGTSTVTLAMLGLAADELAGPGSGTDVFRMTGDSSPELVFSGSGTAQVAHGLGGWWLVHDAPVTSPEVYRSTDGGRTWEPVRVPKGTDTVILDRGGRFATAYGSEGVSVSTDLGASWWQIDLADNEGQTLHAMAATGEAAILVFVDEVGRWSVNVGWAGGPWSALSVAEMTGDPAAEAADIGYVVPLGWDDGFLLIVGMGPGPDRFDEVRAVGIDPRRWQG